MMTYAPKPIPTDGITLSTDILELRERMAEHSHDVWAAQRIAEGWTYGPRRNDTTKEHPCLVPYADLPESEKEYDRTAALQTLKAIIALGYSIVRPSRDG